MPKTLAWTVVRIGDEYNILLPNKTFLFDENLKKISEIYFCEELHFYYAILTRKDGMQNFVRESGTVGSPVWYKQVGLFRNGFAIVEREDNMYNFLTPAGVILCKSMWFYNVKNFKNRMARVQREDGMWNLINTGGNLICKTAWFSKLEINDSDEFIRVCHSNRLWSCMRTDGTFVNDLEQFLWIGPFQIDGFAEVKCTDGMYRKIDKNGKIYKIPMRNRRAITKTIYALESSDSEFHSSIKAYCETRALAELEAPNCSGWYGSSAKIIPIKVIIGYQDIDT